MCRERGKVTKYIYKRHHLSFLMYIVFLEDSRRYQCRWQLNSVIVVFAFYYAWVGALLQLRCTLHYNFLPRLFATFQHFSYFLDRIISYIHRDINKLASNLCDNVFKVPKLLSAWIPRVTVLKLSIGECRHTTNFLHHSETNIRSL